MVRQSNLSIIILLGSITTSFSQLVVVPIEKVPSKKEVRSRSARTQDLTPMSLPFWDDFSFSNSPVYPHDTLWQYGKSVSLNFGKGIRPPSLGVVTFDGLDSLGKPYNVNNALAKGYADKLISRPISLDLVPAGERTTVYLSFYYQNEGNGEPPDPGDQLSLDFKNDAGEWENIVVIQNDGTLEPDTFRTMVLPVAQDRFFHNNFQFRFRSFGRLSGPYDTWNLDYVYLNSGRSSADTSFPDRAIATPLTSLFNEYWAIPKKHFITSVDANLTNPSFTVYNLRDGNNQPLDFFYYADVTTYKGNAIQATGPLLLDSAATAGALLGLTRKTVTTVTKPPVSLFDVAADSFKVNLNLNVFTKDNVLPVNNGDYDSVKYSPVDFRVNDKTKAEFIVSTYYAYDDGTAEYGIGLNQPGAQVAYLFDMRTPDPDTIVAVDIYFPRFGDETSQIIQLRILSDLTDKEQSILYEGNITVDRSESNTFRRYVLSTNTVGVQGSFYIGWKQSSAANIPVGWDKNTDSGDKISFNLNGAWEPNTDEHGSMMIHPVFGKGGVVTGLPEGHAPVVHAFPNPNSGTFYVPGNPERVEFYDFAGRPVGFTTSFADQQTKIEMTSAHPGLYILKISLGGKYAMQRIMVRP